MFEIVEARTGVEIAKVNGRFLSSKYDPIREANSFVDSIPVDLMKFDYLFMIGLSSGYEIDVLLAKFEHLKILVIEENVAIVNWLKGRFDSERVTFVSEPLGSLKSQVKIQNLLRKVYFTTILPCYRADISEIKMQFYNLFQARRPDSFKEWQKLLKRENHLDVDRTPPGELISINDVVSNESSRLSATFKVLKELIA